jgi:phosphoribosylglycinamide formyltransferase-1
LAALSKENARFSWKVEFLMAERVIGVLASGRGSNLQAIMEAIDAGSLAVRLGVVVSDNPAAQALTRAARRGIPGVVIERGSYPERAAFERAMSDALSAEGVELVVLAGFMRILGAEFLSRWRGRVMNIHPSLLPSFPGLHPQLQALQSGARVSGCTVHFVDEGMDTGSIILQKAVPVLAGDTEDTLAERILAEEHRLYPEAIRLWAAGSLTVEGRRVVLSQ